MTIFIIGALAFWWTVLLRAVAQDGYKVGDHSISHQLTGKFSHPVDVAFLALAAAWPFFPTAVGLNHNLGLDLICNLSAVGTAGAMLTRVWRSDTAAHILCAAFAFIGGAAVVFYTGRLTSNLTLMLLGIGVGISSFFNLAKIAFVEETNSQLEWTAAAVLSAGLAGAVLM